MCANLWNNIHFLNLSKYIALLRSRLTEILTSQCWSFLSPGPFEDALRLHEAGGVCLLEDKWPSPPHRRAPVAPTEEQLCQEPWYHGRMSRRDAEKLLIHDGDFLVRDSATNPGQYVLTGMHCGLPKHLLLVDPEGVVSIAYWSWARGNTMMVLCIETPCYWWVWTPSL